MDLFDTAEIRDARITKDGYLVADALVARANNIQTYRAGELKLDGVPADRVVRVFRPEAEVFAADSMASAAHRPITLDHPAKFVDANNWRELARGEIGAEIVRDGEFIRVPVKMMDAGAIQSVQNDRREFSLGYTADIDMTPGTFEGQAYDAVMRSLRYNHLAAVRNARGGKELRIVDERREDAQHGDRTVNLKKILVDGLEVETTDAGERAIQKLQGLLTDALAAKDAAAADVVKLKAEAVAKDAENTKLKDDLSKSKLTPQMLRDAGKAYAEVIGKAKALGVAVGDNDDEITVKRAVVAAKMGDAAKAYTDEHIGIAFDTLTAGVQAEDTRVDPLRQVIGDGVRQVGDGAGVRNLARASQYN